MNKLGIIALLAVPFFMLSAIPVATVHASTAWYYIDIECYNPYNAQITSTVTFQGHTFKQVCPPYTSDTNPATHSKGAAGQDCYSNGYCDTYWYTYQKVGGYASFTVIAGNVKTTGNTYVPNAYSCGAGIWGYEPYPNYGYGEPYIEGEYC